MNLLLSLSAAAAVAADSFNSYEQVSPIKDLLWALIGVAVTILVIRTAMSVRRQLPGADPVNSATVPISSDEAVLALKLAQWRSSVMILITATALGLLVNWFDQLKSTNLATNGFDFAGAMATGLDFYLLVFVPVLVWHLADLIERPRAKYRLLDTFTSHALMVGVLVAFSIAWLLYETGWFTDVRPCGGTFLLLMESCWHTNPAVSLPSKLLVLALLPITLVKLAVALWSRLGPRS